VAGRNETVIWLRPEHAPTGRPAEFSRAQITAAAVAVADRAGLDAVSMRRVAAELGTGAASLYGYVANRSELLDLMADSAAAEYALAEPTGDWLADLVKVGEQARMIMHQHPWAPALVATRATLGPHGVDVLEHVLDVLASHPASGTTKLEAFSVLNAFTAIFVQYERGAELATRQQQVAYLHHVAGDGAHPRLALLLATTEQQAGDPADQFRAILARILAGVLDL
jgi:AcrR family transcriptional regulator